MPAGIRALHGLALDHGAGSWQAPVWAPVQHVLGSGLRLASLGNLPESVYL